MDSQGEWHAFLPYKSAAFTQTFLRKIYEKQNIGEPLSNSYKNGYAFCYYIEHGRCYFEQAAVAPDQIRPVLLFYGATQLLKAFVLTTDPAYPETSRVLAHGVSTRKKKKTRYDFMQDTVHIQKSGLFSQVLAKVFHLPSMEGAKLRMTELLSKIPELKPLFWRINGKTICYPVFSTDHDGFMVACDILNSLAMTKARFFQFLNEKIMPMETEDSTYLYFRLTGSNHRDFLLQDLNGRLYLPAVKTGYLDLPELLVHFLILYNLSMIARYETEWWYTLHFERSSSDLSFIHAFLALAQIKFPKLAGQWLQDREQWVSQ
ncbi:YaaC family protein [Camelliibacillus cellulosilyticus]|uniref:YaaC family protein n=1 Tax=Camelliibacillus cellulosilyticus TaxID=2174486 RepID=A0ABV9GSP4_9BACL